MELCLRSCGSIVFLRRNFMRLRDYGTRRPTNFAGGLMRRSVVLLAALLLVSVLMAGAVSAEDLLYSSTPGVLYEIKEPGTYTLSDDITESGSNETLILISANGVTLDGDNKQITGGTNTRFGIKVSDTVIGTGIVTIKNFANITDVSTSGIYHLGQGNLHVTDVTIGDITNTSNTAGTIAGIYVNTSGTITIRNAKVTGVISGATTDISTMNNNNDQISAAGIYARSSSTTLIEGCDVTGTITSPYYTAGIVVHNWDSYSGATATINNSDVSGSIISTQTNVYGIVGWARQGSLTITGGEVKPTLSGNYVYGVHAYGRGNAINLTHINIDAGGFKPDTSGPLYNASICIAEHATGTKFVIESCTLTNITHAGIKVYTSTSITSSESPLQVTKNSFAFIADSGVMIYFANSGDATRVYTGYIGENTCTGTTLSATVKGNTYYKGIWGLTPGQNVPGVAWTDNSEGWTLAISESGNYKLTESFNLKSMTVSRDGVIIDGGYDKAAGTGNTITAVGTESTIITLNGETTLKNCNIVAADSISAASYATNGFILASKKLILQNSVIDLGETTDTSGSSILLNLKADGSTISGNTLTTGKSTASSSQGILLFDVKTVTIENNVINLNEANSAETSSGSMGVRLYGNAGSDSANIVIKGNTFNTMGEITARESGISIDTTATYSGTIANPVTIAEISGNTFNLAAKNEPTGYGTAIYLNSEEDSAAVDLTAVSGNKITKGTYVLYADKAESDNAASITISGSISENDFAAITGEKFGKKADGLTVTDSLAWDASNILPVVPDIPVEVTGETVKVSDADAFTTDTTTGVATITGEGASIVITPPEGGGSVSRDGTSGEVTIPDGSTIEMKYDDAPVSVPDTNLEGTTFNMTLELDAVPSPSASIIPRPVFSEDVKAQVTAQNPSFDTAAMFTAENTLGDTLNKVNLVFKIKKTWKADADLSKFRLYHVDGSGVTGIPCTTTEEADFYVVTATSTLGFSSYVVGYDPSTPVTPPVNPPVNPSQPAYSSGDGNMNNAYRVLFETNGGSFIRPATDLSAGDRVAQPAAPVKDGYTFAGWYKDAACTQVWSFSDAIGGDMTLYAKWTSGSTTEPTATATAQPTGKPTSAPVTTAPTAVTTTAAPVSTTEPGSQPTLTQAPAPVLGALLGLLAAGVLIRRRE